MKILCATESFYGDSETLYGLSDNHDHDHAMLDELIRVRIRINSGFAESSIGSQLLILTSNCGISIEDRVWVLLVLDSSKSGIVGAVKCMLPVGCIVSIYPGISSIEIDTAIWSGCFHSRRDNTCHVQLSVRHILPRDLSVS